MKATTANPSMVAYGVPDIPAVRRDLEIIVESGCEACGTGTHWLEEREG